MNVAPGELVALYGPSGSGKSTLLLLVAALLAPDAGSIRFEGRDLASLSARQAAAYRMRDIGIVRQKLELIPGLSAIDNAGLKLAGSHVGIREAQRRVLPLLDRLGLGERLSHRPGELSMGERPRVLIARALSGGARPPAGGRADREPRHAPKPRRARPPRGHLPGTPRRDAPRHARPTG